MVSASEEHSFILIDAEPESNERLPSSSSSGNPRLHSEASGSRRQHPTSNNARMSSFASFDEDDFLDDDDIPALLHSLADASPSSSQSHSFVTSPPAPPSPYLSPAGTPTARRRSRQRCSPSLHARSLPQNRPRTLASISFHGHSLKRNDCVELHDGTFLKIVIIEQSGSQVFLKGHSLKRFKQLDGLVPMHLNELMWMVATVEHETAPLSPSSASTSSSTYTTVSLSDVLQVRTIIFTNGPFQRPRLGHYSSKEDKQMRGVLYCRYKNERITTPAGRTVEESVTRINASHCDEGFSFPASDLLQKWSGEDLCRDTQYGDKYTFGDAFCGSGGVSRGAEQAGLKVQWGFDHDPIAMTSWRANFLGAIGETADVADFHTLDTRLKRVDVLHISPPCQTFSMAHTIPSDNDPHNEACIFSVERLLRDCRPRVSTLEETAGLGYSHNENFLRMVIRDHVDLGFSVRWRKAVNCADYGVPQTRKRLFVVGAAPGQPLPRFPQPTHGDRPGLRPFVYINDAIRNIPRSAGNHEFRIGRNLRREPYNGRRFAATLKCAGLSDWHPSGTRPFTARELACLQTFPINHFFTRTNCVKQVGNAVPPRMAKAIFMEVKKELERVDREFRTISLV